MSNARWLGVWRYTQLTRRDETREFKKTTVTKYMTGPTDFNLTELHMHFAMFYYNSLHAWCKHELLINFFFHKLKLKFKIKNKMFLFFKCKQYYVQNKSQSSTLSIQSANSANSMSLMTKHMIVALFGAENSKTWQSFHHNVGLPLVLEALNGSK